MGAVSIVELAWFFTIVGGVIASVLLIRPIVNALKWLLSPRLDVTFSEYSTGNPKDNPKVLQVPPNKPIKAEIRILPKWGYKLRIIEVLSNELRIRKTEIFAKKPRPWMKNAYSDREGNYKMPLNNFAIMRGGISDPTLVDLQIDPIGKGERKNITIRIETEESRKLFIKDLWVYTPVEGEFGFVNDRISKHLENIAAKEGLKVEVRFMKKKIIPGINYKTVYTKKSRILEFPEAILRELTPEEIEAIGFHEIGHFAQKAFLIKMINILAVAAIVIFSFDFFLLKLFGLVWWLRLLPDFLIGWYVGCYSVRWLEYKADKYSKDLIGKEVSKNALAKLSTWARNQKEFTKWSRRVIWKLIPMHPPVNSRIKALEKDC